MEILTQINKIFSFPLIGFIVLYQKTFSPDHGFMKVFYPYGYCKFHPTCSEYARQVLAKDGIAGCYKIAKRIIKCRPGTNGGLDLPPHQKEI